MTAFFAWLKKVNTAWKALAAIGAILGAGWLAHAYLGSYAKASDLGALHVQDGKLWDEIQALKIADAALTALVTAVQADAAATRNDVRSLTSSLLAHPPGGGR